MMRDWMLLDLIRAFQQAGCPVCNLAMVSERRYLTALVWENVNDPYIRDRLGASRGFCPRHAWQLRHVEELIMASHLGTGIIYEDMASRVRTDLDALIASRKELIGQRPRGVLRALITRLRDACDLLALNGPVGRAFSCMAANDLSTPLAPGRNCPLCDHVGYMVTTNLQSLLRGCAHEDVRRAYRASDGLCLLHLRQLLSTARPDQEQQVLFLLEVVRDKLNAWLPLLSEHLRKHIFQYRDEPQTAEEQTSWLRVLAFMAGEEGAFGPYSETWLRTTAVTVAQAPAEAAMGARP